MADVRRTLTSPETRLDDGEPPAALEPACLEHFAPGARTHAFHKAVLALARDTLGLPRPLHLNESPSSQQSSRLYAGSRCGVNQHAAGDPRL